MILCVINLCSTLLGIQQPIGCIGGDCRALSRCIHPILLGIQTRKILVTCCVSNRPHLVTEINADFQRPQTKPSSANIPSTQTICCICLLCLLDQDIVLIILSVHIMYLYSQAKVQTGNDNSTSLEINPPWFYLPGFLSY